MVKNRVKLLCLERGINTPEEFALKVGIGNIKATAIWNEEAILEYNLIEHLTKFFDCSTAYLLCVEA
ncbi:MAG: hypothetical protein K6G28_00670 [Acholeplasmatales bacterium]|nr:hypothetical protein [Acholeplasmatales bacterium]